MSELRVVCYLNQFFGQIGGEDKAGVAPQVFPGAVGAARAVQQALGVACGALCAAVQDRLRLSAVTGMHPENPGVELYRRRVYIASTGPDAARILDETRRLVALGLKLARREPVGGPASTTRSVYRKG